MSQNFALVIIGEKPTFGAPIKYSNELHTAVSVAFCVPSSMLSEMANTVLIVLQWIQWKGGIQNIDTDS